MNNKNQMKMELFDLDTSNDVIIPEEQVIDIPENNNKANQFIEANTKSVTLEHLKNDTIIPVFVKSNETTISHPQFIEATQEALLNAFPNYRASQPQVRVSHTIKGRIPSAINKPVKELLEEDKTIYYERMMFLMELPAITENVNGNDLTLTVGGVRAYNIENLNTRKTIEKFKVFIGFQNLICCNLCISTDGFKDEIRVSDIIQLQEKIQQLFSSYNQEKHLGNMEKLSKYKLSEEQFAHFIGKARMYNHLDKKSKENVFPIRLNDSQINSVVKDYYKCENFGRNSDGSIGLWNLYNLFTEANKSSYIDSNIARNVSAYELSHNLGNSLQNESPNWLLS